MYPEKKIAIWVLLWSSLFIFTFSAASTSDHCDPRIRPDRRTLRSDQLTVLINGYSESRINLLRPIVAAYSTSPIVASVLILWGNPKTSAETLAQLSKNLTASFYGASPISIIPHSTESLNNRFLPRPSFITTRAVLICDDDIEIDTKSFEFAFKIWSSQQNSLVGFFARSHDLDLTHKTWIYTVHPDKYSIMLTKFMIMKTEYLYKYSCEGGEAMREMREVVERMGNCEDILMNLVVAETTKKGPVLVGAEKARDWGDARNEEGGKGEREVGLSSRRGEHRKRRGECIREFHRVWGKMPLVYSYGKIVSGVGEQGLCIKGGNLVFCDHQI
ncbi:Glycosyl transferase 64 domain [Dillenia turbinata]|uniref:Glycosyl transferase 64 domain n=1 Tax=Dillenia turbinata TaxID=194707 RepID=A0AAN8Z611_9MAGN